MLARTDTETIMESGPGRIRGRSLVGSMAGVLLGLSACDGHSARSSSGRDLSAGEGASFDYTLSADAVFDHSELEVIHLEGTLFHSSPAMGLPGRMAVGEGTVWVADAATDPSLHAIDIDTGELLHSFGPTGQGPGEFASYPWGVQVLPSDSEAVWAWDADLQRLTRFEPKPVSDFPIQTIRLEIQRPVSRVVWMASDRILGVSPSDAERFSFFSADGELQGVVSGSLLGEPGVPREARLGATNQGIQVCLWPERGFAIENMNVGRIELYDSHASFLRLAEVPFPSSPVFEPDQSGVLRFRSPRNFYQGCTATKEFLFSLFSGRLDEEYERNRRSSGEFVHVFDWAGELRAVYRLDRDIHQIAVDQRGRTLFGASKVEGAVFRYRLPEIEKN